MRQSLMVAVLFLGACDPGESEAERNDRAGVAKQQEQYQAAQPVPKFDFSLERDVTIQLYRARNARVATHTVWRSNLGMIEGDCPSIGYPIPYDTSLTNPIKIAGRLSQGGYAITEQAEPNGLFASKNSIATWVRCVHDEAGAPVQAPIYIESRVTAYPYPVSVDYDKGRVERAGLATLKITSE